MGQADPDPTPEDARDGGPTGASSPLARPAASAGVVLGGLVLVAAFLPWPTGTATRGGVDPVAAAVGAVALLAFLARRHDLIDRARGAAVAGLASLGALAYAGYGLWSVVRAAYSPSRTLVESSAVAGGVAGLAPDPSVTGSWVAYPPLGTGVVLAAAAGVGGLVVAELDRRAVPDDRVVAAGRTGLAATAVGLGGLLAIVLWQLLIGSVLYSVVESPPRTWLTVVSSVALGLGTATTAGLYLQLTDREWSFVDFAVPDARDVAYAVGGVVAIFGALIGVQVVLSAIGLQGADHGITEVAAGDPSVLLVLIPASWLLIGPGEELLFRNVVQKSLYDRFGRRGALVLASVVFAAVHLPAYSTATTVQTLGSLSVVFVLALILGWLYLRTENLTVPAFVHGTFNAVQFAVLYVQLSGGLPSPA